MPANLTPDYKRAEALFRQATTAEEKIAALELMMQTIPKHKGTEHMRADIKRRLSLLKEGGGQAKGGSRAGDVFHVPKGAVAGQAALLGLPNSGKSSLVAHLTNAHTAVAEFPFTTHTPIPGIMQYEDVPIQLVDMPPITADHAMPGMINTYRQADLIMVVTDLSAADVIEQMNVCLKFLEERMLMATPGAMDESEAMLKRMTRPCFGVCTKADLAKEGDFEVLRQMFGDRLEMTLATVKDVGSLARLSRRIFERLRIVRVYSKLPGKEPDMKDPFTLPAGSTVADLAYRIHRELVEKLHYTRIWGKDKYAGQQVPREYVLQDKDILELHFG
jgi:uncharacterized protein